MKKHHSVKFFLLVLLIGFEPIAFSQTYRIAGTGVTKCFDNTTSMDCPASSSLSFFGQFPGKNPVAYKKNGDGTVTDLITGLTWQSNPDANGNNDGIMERSDKLTWEKIQERVQVLNTSKYCGYSDWRIPTIKELYSLTNWNGTDPSGFRGTDLSVLIPFIDKTFFPFAWGQTEKGERIIDSQYASCTIYNELSHVGCRKLFGFNFADGRIKGYDLWMPGGFDKTFSFIAVRGNPQYGINDFKDNGDQTISDRATGLMWTKDDSKSGMNWERALAWAQEKNAQNYCGYHDWRLPDTKELQSIVDYTRSPGSTNSAAINQVFNCTSITSEGGTLDWPWYWTSTTHQSAREISMSGASAVYVCFGRAAGWLRKPGSTFYKYYDAHGAGAQRSSPKESRMQGIEMGVDSLGKPVYGLGPQGDILRSNNFVRLVRNIQKTK